ncbi:Putative cytochrome P450 superfamily protein [Zea mays]|uniref:Putative cytochrome P450 superfamily protein n=1 Tax=Zea mays TaxID=4577 RepID=A0A1D6M080_MAIZE|nr:Putative cytochrome P450 superfamily protein [Zea mays]
MSQVREGVQVAPVGVAGGGELGPGGEPRGAAGRRVGVRSMVPAIAHGADGAIVHPSARRRPPAPGARPRGRLLQVAAAQGAGHPGHAAPRRPRHGHVGQAAPSEHGRRQRWYARACAERGQVDCVRNPSEGADRVRGRGQDAVPQATVSRIHCRFDITSG